MTNLEKYKAYCISLGEVLNTFTKEAIKNKQNSIGTKNEDFNTGYLNAFYRIITLMQQQAEVYEIPFIEIGVNFNETDLI